jgi:hypothetical protein
MAVTAVAIRLTAARYTALAVSLAAVCLPAFAQTPISLDQLAFRSGPAHSAVYAGQQVVVRGVVNAPAFHFQEYTMLAIQDSRRGGVLKVLRANKSLDDYRPGDELEAQGIVSMQYGMTVVEPEKITVIDHKPAPAPKDITAGEAQSMAHLGELVRVQSPVVIRYRNSGGAGVFVAGPKDNYRVFIPKAPGHDFVNVDKLRMGETVRATGVALQYCPDPPFNSGFQLLVGSITDIAEIEQPPTLPQPIIASGITVILLVGLFLWSRERRLRSQRRRLRRTYKLGEEILGASSAATILKRISEALPSIIGVTRVRLYVYNRTAKTLDAIED